MRGSVNAQRLQNIINKVDAFNIVSGKPGTFSVSLGHAVAAAIPIGMAAAAPAIEPLAAGEASFVDAAMAKSNAAAATTPSASSGGPTSGNTPATTIANAAKGMTEVASTPADIQALEAGASATLHWWGWSLKLNESATQALSRLLTTDITGLVGVAASLTAVSAPLAAVSAIVSAVATGFNDWITGTDTNHIGVDICGYGWIGVWVQSN